MPPPPSSPSSLEAPSPRALVEERSVGSVDGAGIGLFAAESAPRKPLKPGTVVARAAPLAAVVDAPNRALACQHCFRLVADGAALKRCTQCKLMHYCSRDCQKQDWKAHHKQECADLVRCAPRVPGTSVLLLARVLRKHHSTRSGTFFPKLASHPDSYSVEQLSGHMSQFGVLKAFLGDKYQESLKDLGMSFLFKLLVNTFSVCSMEGNPVGAGVYDILYKCNHDCSPNSAVVFHGANAELRVLKNIEPGAEVTISYVDQYKPAQLRQKELLETYKFECQCARCGQEKTSEHAGDGMLLRCQWNSGALGLTKHLTTSTTALAVQGNKSQAMEGSCQRLWKYVLESPDDEAVLANMMPFCEKHCDEVRAMKLKADGDDLSAFDADNSNLTAKRVGTMSGQGALVQGMMKRVNAALARLVKYRDNKAQAEACVPVDEGVIPPSNYLMTQCLNRATDIAISSQQFDQALDLGKQGLAGMRQAGVDTTNPIFAAQILRVAKLCAYAGDMETFAALRAEAAQLIPVTHGERSSLFLQLASLG